jgi:hypothetical protein
MAEIAAIAAAITELIPVFWKLVNLFKEAKRKGWIKDGQELRSAVQSPRTDEESMALAKRLFEHAPR